MIQPVPPWTSWAPAKPDGDAPQGVWGGVGWRGGDDEVSRFPGHKHMAFTSGTVEYKAQLQSLVKV